MSSIAKKTIFKKSLLPMAMSLSLIVLLAGCASTEVTDRQRLVTEKLPKPGNIYVYDFVANSSEVPADSAVAG